MLVSLKLLPVYFRDAKGSLLVRKAILSFIYCCSQQTSSCACSVTHRKTWEPCIKKRKTTRTFRGISAEDKFLVTQSRSNLSCCFRYCSEWPSLECFVFGSHSYASVLGRSKKNGGWSASSSWSRLDVGRPRWRRRQCRNSRPSWRE